MAFKLDIMKAYTVPVVLKVGEQTLTCRVSPEVFASEDFRREMNKITDEIAKKEPAEGEAKEIMKIDYRDYDYALSEVITEWDVVDEANNKVPVTYETVAAMWWQVKAALWDLILEVLSPKALTRSMRPTSSGPKAR